MPVLTTASSKDHTIENIPTDTVIPTKTVLVYMTGRNLHYNMTISK